MRLPADADAAAAPARTAAPSVIRDRVTSRLGARLGVGLLPRPVR
jgi:hypothetical protein